MGSSNTGSCACTGEGTLAEAIDFRTETVGAEELVAEFGFGRGAAEDTEAAD